jgi:hypothetical protein
MRIGEIPLSCKLWITSATTLAAKSVGALARISAALEHGGDRVHGLVDARELNCGHGGDRAARDDLHDG